ncbi:hypothetical protein [Parasphingorhabdus sp.]|uniref:hypothetical protein n=1 Tax=Parasphingorhabdus sp. TaxID=2709688 RepID=UPI0030030ED9
MNLLLPFDRCALAALLYASCLLSGQALGPVGSQPQPQRTAARVARASLAFEVSRRWRCGMSAYSRSDAGTAGGNSASQSR